MNIFLFTFTLATLVASGIFAWKNNNSFINELKEYKQEIKKLNSLTNYWYNEYVKLLDQVEEVEE